ncbi:MULTISPECIES: hypothetical protein [unclassified Mesorhizobium]|uniref:hypothetical protein n=1 Tax=unclassified Mesorhizobium TaxID=325217 RepID=UPI000FCC6EB2|nr:MULTISPECIES: hypothetical protein [unclassified Mesorhizobium]RUX97442.1 hypothetical protein EN993_03835 [Mesorhizobium sp. M7D.F.Ca.US.004.01.2.1]RVA36628.1 hypothetical protein EN935_01645 [Mesorhizobium sp. M7D.F.Ca.US.004.03.1.1]
MANPWDPFEFPLVGTRDESILFEALGRAVSRWESVEWRLATMYSLFAYDPTWTKMREYGAGTIFRKRLDSLGRIADAWFAKFPNQAAEGAFQSIVTTASGFSNRRNEFAHGIVRDLRDYVYFHTKLRLASVTVPQFVVVPPLHSRRGKDGDFALPAFGYSSLELDSIYNKLLRFEDEIDLFSGRLWPDQWPSHR